MDNLSMQVDEIEALLAIYENEMKVIDESTRTYLMTVYHDAPYKFDFEVMLPSTYPSNSPPSYQIRAPWLSSAERSRLNDDLRNIHIEHTGESILYVWFEYLRNFVQEKVDATVAQSEPNEPCQNDVPKPDVCFNIWHGDPIKDRRSTFQAHAAVVNTVQEVNAVRDALMANRKVANATHNILVYRIFDQSKKRILQDYDDDGESGAGIRLLHLLDNMDVRNVVVIVSRWYGGILLGPDRFKHINNVAKSILVQNKLT